MAEERHPRKPRLHPLRYRFARRGSKGSVSANSASTMIAAQNLCAPAYTPQRCLLSASVRTFRLCLYPSWSSAAQSDPLPSFPPVPWVLAWNLCAGPLLLRRCLLSASGPPFCERLYASRATV
jgi:hypothetical protein